MLRLAGDTVIDWIIHDKQTIASMGGIGNVARGLLKKGHPVKVTTLYNPMIPVHNQISLAENSVQDFHYHDVYIRDYDKGEFKRFREGLRPSIFVLKDIDVVVAHKDSCIKEFTANYADVRDTSVKGSCRFLRMSSTDDWEKIMAHIEHTTALVTHKDKVVWFPYNTKQPVEIPFLPAKAVDDIGAGDTFNVGFIHSLMTRDTDWAINDGIESGIIEAHNKVIKVGVYID